MFSKRVLLIPLRKQAALFFEAAWHIGDALFVSAFLYLMRAQDIVSISARFLLPTGAFKGNRLLAGSQGPEEVEARQCDPAVSGPADILN